MPAFLLAARMHWKLIVGGLLLMALLVQTVRLERANRRADKAEFSNRELRAVLDEADRRARELQAQVDGQIRQLPIIIERAVPKGLESRPLPQNCETPDAKEWGAVL